MDFSGTYVEDGSCHHEINSASKGPAFLGEQRTTGSGQVYYVPNKSGTVEETDPVTLVVTTVTVPSPLVDAGVGAHCLARDQLGRSRSAGASCDLGAIEYVPPRPKRTAVSSNAGARDVTGEETGATAAPSTCETRLPDSITVSGYVEGAQCQQVFGAGVGNQEVLEAGFLLAVDIWGYLGGGARVCFNQSGNVVFLDAASAPRSLHVLPSTTLAGRTCASIDRPGTVVLLPAGSPLASGPLPQSPIAPTSSERQLTSCMVTTTHILNFRSEPGIGDNVLQLLPYQVSLTAESRTDDWFLVDYHGAKGWISADYVSLDGACQ